MVRPRAVAGLLAFTLIAGTGCRTWQPAGAITETRGRSIRVSTPSLDRVEMRGARIEGDSVVGRLPNAEVALTGANPRVAVALADVRTVEEHRLSARRTTAAVIGGVLGAVVLWGLLILSSGPITLY
jgi:uncharacterized protein (DUF2236 family)